MENSQLEDAIGRFVRMAADFEEVTSPHSRQARFENAKRLVDLVVLEAEACEIVEVDSDAELVILESDNSLVRLRRQPNDEPAGGDNSSFWLRAFREPADSYTVSVAQELVPRHPAGLDGSRDWCVEFENGQRFDLFADTPSDITRPEDVFGRALARASGLIFSEETG